MGLSIILTCYNETPIIFESYVVLAAMMRQTTIDVEFVIVDDGSQTEVCEELERYFQGRDDVVLILSEENEGRGGAVTKGLRAATRPYVCFIDTDLEIPAYSILALYFEATTSQADIVMAERVYRWRVSLHDWIRNWSSMAYRRFSSGVLSLRNLDTETGSKLFRRDSVLRILDRVLDRRWFWDTEIVAEAIRDGQRITQVPIVVMRRLDKASSVHVFRDTIRYVKAIYAYKKRLIGHRA
jgi:glycosyltransferase involved in cell wall biosynthesis